MPAFAAVDIGSNSVRLKIARAVRGRLETLHEDREVTRLGEGVFSDGVLDPQSMALTMRVLRRFHKATQTHAADKVWAVATSALRDARNSRAFLDWVRSTTGWKADVISGLEEGRLIHLGILSHARIGSSRALLVDLGGGSCELTLSIGGHIEEMVSLPIGAVRLTKTFLRHDTPRRNELEQMRTLVHREVLRIQKRILEAKVQVTLATSGTAAALSGLYGAKMRGYDESKPHTVPQDAVAQIYQNLCRKNLAQRQSLPGIGPRRAEIIIAGATVFDVLMRSFMLRSFRYLPLGLRDGMLAQMMADYNGSTVLRERVESERHEALTSVARHYGTDMAFAQRIRDLALQLFRKLQPVHQLPQQYVDWLEAAALLHEVGSFINRSGRRRHSYYIIAHSEIYGYTPVQRRIIAAIARYVGKSLPGASDRVMRLVPTSEQPNVYKAVSLLRLARALDQGRRGAVHELKVKIHQDGRVRLMLKPNSEGIELELWSVAQEKNYFETVFGRELLAEAF